MQNLLKQCRKDGKIHDYLLEKIDYLRTIRNPFTHPKSASHPLRLSRRMLEIVLPPEESIEEDAKNALCLRHTLFLTNQTELDLKSSLFCPRSSTRIRD
jgi:hypothetical protein